MTDSEWGPVFPTVHPSSVLRARQADRALARSAFFQDIRAVRRAT
jgi:uracil-DNA glycosylase